jgi:hypothetical protein
MRIEELGGGAPGAEDASLTWADVLGLAGSNSRLLGRYLRSWVTTILAVAYLGVAVGLGEGSQALGARAVLATNVVMMMAAAAITLSLQCHVARSRKQP